MLKCNKCGQNLPAAFASSANFCPQCGNRLSGEGTTAFHSELAMQQRLIEISRAINSTLDLDALLEKINLCACELTCADTGSTMLYDSEKDELYFKVALGDKKDILRRLTVRDDPPSIAWWVFKNGLPAIVNDTASDPRFSGTVDKVTSFNTKSILCVPIVLEVKAANTDTAEAKAVANLSHHTESKHSGIIGVIEVINKLSDPPRFTVEDQRILSILAYQAATAVRNAKAAGDRRNFFINAIEMFITAIESTGFVSPGHCMRVARSSIGMAHKLGVEHDDLHNLYYASALHDIGVLDIRCRQNPVSNGSCPKSHTIIGAEMVRPVNLLARTEPIIHHHHEAWDGSGYPDGLSRVDIPLGARIVAVAESYEEIGLGNEFIAANAGKLFDPDVVDAFLEAEI